MEVNAMNAEGMVTTTGKTIHELWWIGVIEATLALFFGITALFWPGMTLAVLTYLFSAFVIGVGIVEVVGGFMSRHTRISWWVTVLLGIVAGIIVFYQPVAGGVAFVWVLGLYAIIFGTLGVVTSLALREDIVIQTSLLEEIARSQESREKVTPTPRARARHRTA